MGKQSTEQYQVCKLNEDYLTAKDHPRVQCLDMQHACRVGGRLVYEAIEVLRSKSLGSFFRDWASAWVN